nr:MAG TPA: hypothetical protein [Caudoviricetes sp.]
MAPPQKHTPDIRSPSYADARQRVSRSRPKSVGWRIRRGIDHWAWADGAL